MATTTNFGWETPDDTDLVKDGAAAIRTALGGVDTSFVDLKGGTTGQVLKKNTNTDLDFVWSTDSAGMTNPMTTTGDTIYSSSGSTPARLGIGTTGQVLTVTGGVPVWATASGWNPNYQLLNAGGTALTGATSVTVSGISGKNSLLIAIDGASSANAGATIYLRMNADSGSNYAFVGLRAVNTNAGSTGGLSDTRINIGVMGNTAADSVTAVAIIQGTNAAGLKPVTTISNAGGTDKQSYAFNGYYAGTSTISSITIHSDSGNLDAGTVYVYGA